MSETLTTIQIRRGVKAQLPSVAEVGELLLTTDTHELFVGTGTGVVPITVGGTPGGGDTQVQYNDAGVFDGDPAFTYADETQQLAFGATMPGASAQFQCGGVGAAFVGVGGTQSICGIDCGEDRPDQVLIANGESPNSNGIKICNVGQDGTGSLDIGWEARIGGGTDPPYRQQITLDASGIATSTPDLLDLASGGVGSATFLRGGTTSNAGYDINSNTPDKIVMINAEPASAGILIQDSGGTSPGGPGAGNLTIGIGNSLNAPTRFITIDAITPGILLEDTNTGGAVVATADFTGMGTPAGAGLLIADNTQALSLGGDGTHPFTVTLGEAVDKLSFYNGTGGTKPTVTGSRGGNAALASLLTALATLGLITNGTSA